MRVKRFFRWWLTVVLLLPAAAFGQEPQAQENPVLKRREANFKDDVITLSLDSKLMGREMPYRIILPYDYKTKTKKRFPVIYLLHGLTGRYDNWTERTKLAEYTISANAIIVTPEGGDGWYSDSVSKSNDKYESYIIRELIPEIDKRFRTTADREYRAVAGLSMGGYGAIKFGLKYPERFALVGSFSGALGAASLSAKMTGGFLPKSIGEVFGDEASKTRAANDIFKIVREISPEKIKTLPFIYLDCGTEDFLFQNNRDFVNLLVEKKIPHEFRQLPGGHNWTYWDAQVQEFLRLTDKFLKKTAG